MRQLRPYQQQAVNYLQKKDNPALFMEMRLGKTICVVRAFENRKRVLVVCPKPVIPVWEDELEQENKLYTAFFSPHLKQQFFSLPKWCICNYEAAYRLSENIIKKFDTVVCDESFIIAHPKAKITQFMIENFRHAKRCILSGNPAPNSSLEYYPQMQFLHGSWMDCDNFWKFRHKYFTSDVMGWQFWVKNGAKAMIKEQLEKDAFILSRKDVGLDNEKIYEKRFVEMPKSVEKIYRKMEKEFVLSLPSSNEEIEINHVLAQLNYLQQMASGFCSGEKIHDFKFKELLSLLMGELKGEKVVVFCNFLQELDYIVEGLVEQKINAKGIDGRTSIDYRKMVQQEFQNGKLMVIVNQVSSGKFGVNYSVADTVIYFSNSLKADDRTQSEDRIVRIGKKTPNLYIDLITKNTVNEELLKTLQKKDKQAKYFLGQVVDEIRKKY